MEDASDPFLPCELYVLNALDQALQASSSTEANGFKLRLWMTSWLTDEPGCYTTLTMYGSRSGTIRSPSGTWGLLELTTQQHLDADPELKVFAKIACDRLSSFDPNTTEWPDLETDFGGSSCRIVKSEEPEQITVTNQSGEQEVGFILDVTLKFLPNALGVSRNSEAGTALDPGA